MFRGQFPPTAPIGSKSKNPVSAALHREIEEDGRGHEGALTALPASDGDDGPNASFVTTLRRSLLDSKT
jgi:hypothetical protein